MDLKRKLEIVDQAIASIVTHTDADAAVRKAALERIELKLITSKDALGAEIKDSIANELGESEASA